ncbi:calcium/proton exchanger [Cenococcum geophilum]
MAYLDLINILLLAIPVSFVVNYLHVNGITIFIVNFITIIPLTVMLNYTTKEIALRASNILGSLLNATFRNAVKLIISILALTKGQITIVKTSLISSMLSNLLLILSTTAGLLALCVSSLIIPTAFYSTLLSKLNNSFRSIIELSCRIAIILLIIYGVIITLRISTALVAFCSEFMVNSISNITVSGTVSTTFIGLILLLIVRNATKYIIAVIIAYKDKINLVINVTIRSSQDYITLYFNTFLIAVLFVTDSKSNWLEGVLIMAIYTIITVTS